VKLLDETLPVNSLESAELAFPGLSQSTDSYNVPLVHSDEGEQSIPEISFERSGASRDLNTSTPRPSRKQSLAHVLVVDDNEINLKVRLTVCL
jgi:hypothetical protein